MINNPFLSLDIHSYIDHVLGNKRDDANIRSLSNDLTYLDSPYGIMYLDAWLGTPSQRVTLAISLTTDLMVIPCNDVCNSDCEGNPYLSRTSHTFTNVTCDRCSEYVGRKSTCDGNNCLSSGNFLDGSISWNGALSSDMAYFGGAPVEGTPNIAQEYGSRFIFGCQMKYNNNTVISRWVRKRANGIISFSASEHSLMSQLHKSNLIQNPNFALCFYSRLSVVGPAGVLSLGGYTLVEDDESSPLLYLKAEFKKKYSVFIENVFLHSETNNNLQNNHVSYADKLNNDGKGAIIDVGSPLSVLGSDQFGKEFRNTWKKMTGDGFPEDGGTFLPTDIPNLPTIKIQFKATGEKDDNTMRRRHTRQRSRKLEFGFSGVVGKELDAQSPDDVLLSIPPNEYLDYDDKTLSYHIRLFIGSSDRQTILGGNLFRSHLLFFNLEESKIGVAVQSYCGRATIQNKKKDSNQYNYNTDEKTENGSKESSTGNTPPTSNAQASPNSEQSQMESDQNSQMSNPISTASNDKTITMNTDGDDVDGTMSSFSMNAAYYICAVVLFCLYIALSIYSCRSCSRKRRRRQSM